MSETEFFELKASIDSDDVNSTGTLQVLQRLKDMQLPSVTLLRKTLIAKSIRQLASRTTKEDVRLLALDIEKLWRQAFRDRVAESPDSKQCSRMPLSPKQIVQVGQTEKIVSKAKSNITQSEANNKQDTVRDAVRKLLTEALCLASANARTDDSTQPFKRKRDLEEPVSLASRIEEALHSQLTNIKEYKAQARSIAFNVKDEQNVAFRSMLMLGELSPDELPRLSAEAMASDSKKASRQQVRREAMDSVNEEFAAFAGSGEGLFACEKCQSLSTTNFQLPTTNPDAAPTVVVTCSACGYRWNIQDKPC